MQMHFDPDKVARLLQNKKTAKHWSGFHPKDNHRGLLIGTAILFDDAGIAIPGMTLQIELRMPTIVDDCLITLSIFQRIGSRRHRGYQLEVCPQDKLSHNGQEPVYGPHEHMPNGEVRPVREIGVDCQNWQDLVACFLSRTNIDPFDLEQPC